MFVKVRLTPCFFFLFCLMVWHLKFCSQSKEVCLFFVITSHFHNCVHSWPLMDTQKSRFLPSQLFTVPEDSSGHPALTSLRMLLNTGTSRLSAHQTLVLSVYDLNVSSTVQCWLNALLSDSWLFFGVKCD